MEEALTEIEFVKRVVRYLELPWTVELEDALCVYLDEFHKKYAEVEFVPLKEKANDCSRKNG